MAEFGIGQHAGTIRNAVRHWLGIDDIRRDCASLAARVDMTIMLQLRAHTQLAMLEIEIRRIVAEIGNERIPAAVSFDFRDTL